MGLILEVHVALVRMSCFCLFFMYRYVYIWYIHNAYALKRFEEMSVKEFNFSKFTDWFAFIFLFNDSYSKWCSLQISTYVHK